MTGSSRGEYPTRDQQADARKEAGDAYEFYKERFRSIFKEFGVDRVQDKAADAAGKVERLAQANRSNPDEA